MYGSLLAMIFFLPFSYALIAVCQAIMSIAWAFKFFLLCKTPSRRDRSQGFDFSPGSMVWPLIAIGLLIVLTIPFSHYPALSIKKFFTRFLQQIFLMYLVTQVIDSRKRLYSVLAMLLLTFFVVAVDAMVQYTWGHSIVHHKPLILGRVSGALNHPNDLGTFLVTVLPMVLALAINSRRWTARGVISVLFLLLIIVLGLTSSRGAWLAFAVSMLALGACLSRRRVVVLIVLLLAVFFWIFGVHCLKTRTDLYNGPGSPVSVLEAFSDPSARGLYWDTAIGVIKKYPWFGCGYNAYVQTLNDLNIGHTEYPHNSLLHITAELGLVGLVFYLWLFVALCLQGWRTICRVASLEDIRILGYGISCGILAWMIHSLLDTPWSSLQLSLLLWLMIGILLSLDIVLPTKGD